MYPVSILSIICAGGIYSAAAAILAPSEAKHQFTLLKPKVVFCTKSTYDSVKSICAMAGIASRKIYVIRSEVGHHDIYNPESGVSLVHRSPLQWQTDVSPAGLNTTIFIPFTSGTSGYPKYRGVNLF